MARFKVPGMAGVSIGGHYYKAVDGVLDISPAEAAHLALTYWVVPMEGPGKDQPLGVGRTNAPASMQPKKTEISKEMLLALDPTELKEKAKALNIKVTDDMSRGDIAEKVVEFVEALSRARVAR